jgi:hypothetical protein
MAVGNFVMVCSNLMFFGDVVLSRKHTTEIILDLPSLVEQAINEAAAMTIEQDAWIGQLKNTEISNRTFADLLMEGLYRGTLTASKSANMVHNWRHDGRWGQEPTLWKAMNVFTEDWKATPNQLHTRTIPRSEDVRKLLEPLIPA